MENIQIWWSNDTYVSIYLSHTKHWSPSRPLYISEIVRHFLSILQLQILQKGFCKQNTLRRQSSLQSLRQTPVSEQAVFFLCGEVSLIIIHHDICHWVTKLRNIFACLSPRQISHRTSPITPTPPGLDMTMYVSYLALLDSCGASESSSYGCSSWYA